MRINNKEKVRSEEGLPGFSRYSYKAYLPLMIKRHILHKYFFLNFFFPKIIHKMRVCFSLRLSCRTGGYLMGKEGVS